MPWDRVSRRHDELPHDWPIITRDVLDRDGHRCQLRLDGCTVVATEVDHLNNRHCHGRSNLRAACHACHGQRTAGQGHAAMRAIRAKAQHPVERHPGRR